MAHQMHDLKQAYAADGSPWATLRLDGGMSANDWVAQDLADMLDLEVERPHNVETTALGAAMLAAVGCGLHATLSDAAAMRSGVSSFVPHMDAATRERRLDQWRALLALELGQA
jgi:glycerol kinase